MASAKKWPRKVTTTFGHAVTVDEAEYLDLKRQGLVVSDAPARPASAPAETDSTETESDSASNTEGSAS